MKRIIQIFRSVIDVRMGLLGALLLGGIVFWINREHGWQGALPAALKQAIYTFFFGGFVVKACEHLARRIEPIWLAGLAWTLIPAGLAVGATYLVHTIKGTPEPFASTVPTLILAPVSFLFIGYFKRKKSQKPPN